MEGGRYAIYLFNITNADKFMSGEDYKLKLEEIGPFTYVEYRSHDKLKFSDSGEMSYIPRMRAQFILEESVADTRDVQIVMPNIPMLSATTILHSSPLFIKNLYSIIVRELRSTAIVKMDAHKYLWGYEDPVLTVANNLVPGLIHFKTTGILDRFYDNGTKYQMVLSTEEASKFQIKSVTKYRNAEVWSAEDIPDSTTVFNDTYEGMAYPPLISTSTPINIYRLGVCRTYGVEFCGIKSSEYGPNAFVYKFRNDTFYNTRLCDGKGFCPQGIMDMSRCFFGIPMAMSKGHFLDADPALMNRIEGLKPDPGIHSSHMVIEPKIGLTLETSLSLQVNIMVGDVSYNSDASQFSNMVVPLAHFKIIQPELPSIAITALRLIYITVPKVVLITEIILVIAGLLLLGYSVKLIYTYYIFTIQSIDEKKAETLLVKKDKN
ncbi:scavenger receptor class B member 1 isoform X2 [Manduca sexta]|nr:scavenger receptor class B member 1 isoform X2 [Manduca sexta]